VLVVGGGPAASARGRAAQAARAVVLAERYGFLGWKCDGGAGHALMSFHTAHDKKEGPPTLLPTDHGPRTIIAGALKTSWRNCESGRRDRASLATGYVCRSPEWFKLIALEISTRRAAVFFHAFASRCWRRRGVEGAVFETKSDRCHPRARHHRLHRRRDVAGRRARPRRSATGDGLVQR